MCGIVGIINMEGSQVNNVELLKMTSLLAHRGPDAQGIFSDDFVALGHRRLSIIDLTEDGKQPMCINNKHWICFNGEIYNYQELREDLISQGVPFKSTSDTEVLLAGLVFYGIEFIHKVNGMFSIIFYDSEKQEVHIIRDRLGIKPLYYSLFNGKIIVSSEIKSILAYPGFKASYSPEGISCYLSFRYPIGHHTLFNNISVLKPGNYIKIRRGEPLEQTNYWEIPLPEENEDLGEAYYLDEIKKVLHNSVQKRMVADVNIGAYLSGGVDSSAIVAFMSQLSKNPITTFTIGFKEEGYNEFDFAKQVAEQYKTDHHELLFSPENYFSAMKELIRFKDSPLSVPNEPALYWMSKELKQYFTVVLSGEGADEIFGGYGKIFRSAYDYERIAQNKNDNKELRKNIINKYGDLSCFSSVKDHFLHQYQYIKPAEKKRYLSNEFYDSLNDDQEINKYFDTLFNKVKHLTVGNQYLWVFENVHLQGLLNRVDTTTMAASVEARVPFVDHELVELAFKIPFKYKLKWNSESHKQLSKNLNSSQISENFDTPKYILKKSLEAELPPEILYRKKVGFPVPIHKWLNNDFKTFCSTLLLSDKARRRGVYNIKHLEELIHSEELLSSHATGLKLWMLLNLELWFSEYID